MSSDHSGKPWARQPGETVKAYQAFVTYLELGPNRSIIKAIDAAGKVRGNRGWWERWSARNDWVRRAEAFDAEQLLDRMSKRVEVREQIRQRIYDEAGELVASLLALQRGEMRDGDQTEILDKHQNVIGSRPVVGPSVRAQVQQHLLALIGLVVPKRVELSGRDGDEIRIQARAAVSGLEPEQLTAIAKAIGVKL